MPSISNKAELMPASPIRKLVPYAEAAKKRGVKVFHLNIGQPDIPTPEVALNAIKNMDIKVLEYSHSAGNQSYINGLVGYYQSVGIALRPEEIIITTGGSEALLFGFMSCFNEGDEVIIPEPFYANYNGFAVAAGVKVVPIISNIGTAFSLPPIEEFEKQITPNTKGILICNPGNPTGYLYSKEELLKLRELVLKHDLYLFADEVYREFCYDGQKHHSIMNLEGIEENAVLIDSVSKRYSMCGARIGSIISRNKHVMDAALKFAQARLSPPSFGQWAGEAALKTPLSYFKEVIDEYVKRRDVVIEGLNKIPGVFSPKPKGAFYTIAQLPVKDSDHFCQWMLEKFEHKGATVMMAPATGFYSNPIAGKQQVRIAFVLNIESLTQAVECLAEALKVYPERT
jgi:aspartate aminotransferase